MIGTVNKNLEKRLHIINMDNDLIVMFKVLFHYITLIFHVFYLLIILFLKITGAIIGNPNYYWK